MVQEVIITLRGTAELKEMLVSLSKLKQVPMNAVVADLIRKDYKFGGREVIEMPIPVKRPDW